jgi:regulation of enolase protein 1 (concanavalin A-like superfamily)/fibronectin type 3 domain-containing protein
MFESVKNSQGKIVRFINAPLFQLLENRQLFGSDTVQTLPFLLDFGSDKGELLDKDGQGTGFTRTQSNNSSNSYQPNLIDLDTGAGVLKITSTAGSNSTSDNNLVNGLETQFDGTISAGFQITARLKGPLTSITANYQQAGIYFGKDQDNYVKLVAVNGSSGNVLQFKDELNGAGATLPSSVQNVNIGSFANITTLDLRISGDASTGKISAYYSINGGAYVKLSNELTLTGTNKNNFFNSTSRAGLLVSNKGTSSTITAVYDSFEIKAGTPAASRPTVTDIRPRSGAISVSRDAFIAVDVNLPTPGKGVDASTLAGNVLLYRTSDHSIVPGVINTSGGGDAIVFTPSQLLAANTQYTFEVTDGVQDTGGASFVPYTSSFTTGTAGGTTNTSFAFEQVSLNVAQGQTYTCVKVGPDGKLYASTIDGLIQRFNRNADGTLSSPTTITTIQTNNGGPRMVTGFDFDPSSTSSNVTLWVNHGQYAFEGATDWTGKLSKLSGTNLATYQDMVIGLPRSIRDHLNNQPVFGPDGKLYFSQASSSAMGAPDNAWGLRSEHLLTAAILQVDPSKLTGTLDVRTEGVANPYNPFASNAAVKIYASGVRNAFDLLWHSNGKLYAPTNGSASGGATPASPNPAYSNSRIDQSIFGDYTGPVAPGIAKVTETEHDWLFAVSQNGYYGHPNPSRYEWVMNGGNPTSGADLYEVSQYPVGTQPDRNYRGVAFDFGQNYSPNGVIEYTGSAFNNGLKGKLLVVRYSGGDDIMVLTPDSNGNIVSAETGIAGFKGFVDPVDLTQDSSGNIYVAEYGGQKITLLRPIAPGANISVDKDKFYFNDVKTGVTGGTGSSPFQSLTITNTGTSALALPADGLTITGTDASQFTFVNPGLPLTIQPGASAIVQLAMNATATGIKTANLVIKSNDADAPTLTISLRGLGTSGTGGDLEPSLQKILDLFQIPDNVGDNDSSTTVFPVPPVAGNDEVTMQRLQQAGPGNVTIELLGVFANSKSPAIRFGYYQPGTPEFKTELFTVAQAYAQSVSPAITGTTSFDPTGDFAIYGTFPAFTNREVYSEDALNTWESNSANRRKIRFYPLKNSDGSTVPNAYVFAFEEYTLSYDQNDIIGIIRNVKAAPTGAEIGLQNMDGGPFADRLIFNRIQNLDALLANRVHDQSTLRIKNTGSSALDLTNLTLSGPFQFVSGGSATTINPGSSTDVTIKFTGSNQDITNGTLTISSNDADEPVTTVQLVGWWQSYSEDNPQGQTQEPKLAELISVFGYNVKITNTGQNINTGGSIVKVGEEVLSPYWYRADVNAPVNVRMLAAFHKQKIQELDGTLTNTASVVKWFYEGSATETFLFKHYKDEGQSLYPHLDNNLSKWAEGNITPSTSAFGFKVDSRYSDPAKNPLDNGVAGTGHAFRFYIAKDRSGKVIPNTYIMAQDYTALSYSNYDYQDNVYIITNVRPKNPPTAVVGAGASGQTAGNVLNWTKNTEGNVAGYLVYRSDSSSGPWTSLTPEVLTTNTFTDTSAPAGMLQYYRITAVDVHGGESSPTVVSATRTSAGTTPTAPGNLVAQQVIGGIGLTWSDNSNNETGFIIERALDPNGSWNIINTTIANATSFTDNNVTAGITYHYRVSATNGAGTSAPTGVASAVAPAQAAMASQDIGGVTPAGSTSTITDGIDYDITAGGANIWGTSDQFRYVYKQISGDFDVKVQITSLLNNDPKAKAGIMARASLSANAANAYMRLNPIASNGPRFSYRTTSGGSTSTQGSDSGTAPMWVRLKRAGSTFSAFYSSDGTNWTSSGSISISMGSSIYLGLATCANISGQTTAAQYRSFGDTSSVPTIPNAPSGLAATGGNNQVSLSWADNSNNETGFIIERSADGVTFDTTFNVAANVTGYTDTAVTAGLTYTYRVRATNGVGTSDPSNTSSATPTSTPIAALTSIDIGGVTPAGSTTTLVDGVDYDISAGGANIWGSSDQFRYVYKEISGDFDVKVQINSLLNNDPKAKAGIMARASLDANAANAYMRLNPIASNGPRFSYRTTAGGSTSTQGSATGTAPMWVRLQRVGNTFNAFYSSDGSTWTSCGTQTIAMNSSIFLGLATCANISGQTTVAQYRSFGDTSPATPVAPAAPSDLVATAGENQVSLVWADNSNNETGFIVERSSDGVTFDSSFNVTANTTNYTDVTAIAEITYTYRVKAINGALSSDYSNTSFATPTAPTIIPLTSIDIGNPNPSGSTNVIANDQYDLSAGGADIWGTSDQFRFAYKQLTGDFDVRVRIASITNANGGSMAGLMARTDLTANSRNVVAKANASNAFRMTYRTSTGGTTTGAGSGAASFPTAWVRLVRSGNTFTTYYSGDGSTWTQLGSVTMSAPTTMYVGLVASARQSGVTTTAQFRDLTWAAPGPLMAQTDGLGDLPLEDQPVAQ